MTSLITLDVSGHKFKTTTATLKTSPYFFALLTRWEQSSDKQDDGSYFVDADPNTFNHLLDFMRRPSHFPLFWTKEDGFDHVLYQKLEAEAGYFLLDDLRDWIRNRRYLEAVKTVVETQVLEKKVAKAGSYRSWAGHAKIEVHCIPLAGTEFARNGCEIHEKATWPCRQCDNNFRPPTAPEAQVCIVGVRTVFNMEVCVNSNWEPHGSQE